MLTYISAAKSSPGPRSIGAFLTYALGRELEYYDQPVVRSILRQCDAGNYRFRDPDYSSGNEHSISNEEIEQSNDRHAEST